MKHVIITTLALLTLSACSYFEETEQPPLEGDRLSLYDFEKTLRPDPNTHFGMDGSEDETLITLPESITGGEDETLSLVAPWSNKFWPQSGGYPNHTMKHVAFTEGQAKKIWATSIGDGTTRRNPLTSAPIVAENMVFTMDTDTIVQATSTVNGDKLWRTSVVKKGEDETVIGGGIAYSGGRLYVTNGFNEILALKPDTGRILWRTETPDTLRGAPSAVPGRVFVSGMNNKTFALDSASGQILWQHSGLTGGTSVLGASTPAIDKDAIITAYTSGEVYALRIENGQELWAENLSPIARAAGQSLLTDIRALPVIDKGAVYSVSNANRMAAIDMRTGLPKWQVSIGSSQTPWVSGNRTYVIGSQSSLIALDNENGDIIWQQALPKYEDPDDREGLMVWSGPILAGNRLLAFSSEGLAIEFNPLDGSIIRRWDTDGDVMLPVAIADETLYIVTENGVVSAWK